MSKVKNVVVLGGGNGSAIAVNALKGLVPKITLSVVVSSSDNGFSSGALRKKFNILPPGDIMRAVLALSPYDFNLLRALFYKNRLTTLPRTVKKIGGSRGPNVGNLFLALVSQYEGNFTAAVRALEEAVEAVGHAYSVTAKPTTICAELTSGEILCGEAAIDRPTYNRKHKVKRVWLERAAMVAPDAQRVIKNADVIILAPGSLYASLVATLLPGGVAEAIKKTAQLVYIAGDGYEAHGETGPETLSGFVYGLEQYLPRPVDGVVYNNAALTPRQKRAYKQHNWKQFTKDVQNLKQRKLIGANIERPEAGLSSEKLAPILRKIIFS
jgi:uncharacterized cofD-like protein